MRLPSDPRKRQLAVLGGATLVFALLAGIALFQRDGSLGSKFETHPLFPGLTAQANGVGEIAIEDKTGGFHIRKTSGTWGMVERNLFPADESVVRAALVGLSGMQVIQKKTANKEYFSSLGLAPPDTGGDAIRISLYDGTGKNIADMLFGKSEAVTDNEGRSSYYVRKPDENQTWLARGFFSPKPLLSDWLDKQVMNVTRDRIQSVRVTAPSGPAYKVSRAAKTDDNFTLEDMPKGRELSYSGAANTVAYAVTGFAFDDVRPASDIDFTNGARLTTETFEGLQITFVTVDKDGVPYAQVEAQALKPEAASEAEAITARTRGWAFKLPAYEAELFRTGRDTLLKNPGIAAP